MQIYRATLRPRSATRTPWQADTLFGHLCWLILYRQGEAALAEFLAHYAQGRPPLIFSNGCPGALLPRPLLPPPPPDADRTKQAQIKGMQEAKTGKGVRWVSLDEFDDLRRGERVRPIGYPFLQGDRTVLKNQVNRLTFGTTPVDDEAGGGLYNADELAFVDRSGVNPVGYDISIYVKAADESWAAEAETLLGALAKSGFGARKSTGYGQFELQRWERFSRFEEEPAGMNGFISLSNWVPAATDPTNGFFRRLVKYGKLGEELATAENPFKFPLITLAAGSAFYTGGPVADWYGRLVENIAPADERLVQYGYAFAVPAHLSGRP